MANLIEIHEDRIRALEDGVTEVRVDIGVLKSQLSDGFEMVSEKLDGLSGLKERIEAMEVTEKVRYRVFKIAVSVITLVAAVAGFFIKLIVS